MFWIYKDLVVETDSSLPLMSTWLGTQQIIIIILQGKKYALTFISLSPQKNNNNKYLKIIIIIMYLDEMESLISSKHNNKIGR